MTACDGFYDDGLAMTLWWSLMAWDSVYGDLVVVSDGVFFPSSSPFLLRGVSCFIMVELRRWRAFLPFR